MNGRTANCELRTAGVHNARVAVTRRLLIYHAEEKATTRVWTVAPCIFLNYLYKKLAKSVANPTPQSLVSVPRKSESNTRRAGPTWAPNIKP